MTVEKLIHLLKMLPPDAQVHVVDGREVGIVIKDDLGGEYRELAFFSTRP